MSIQAVSWVLSQDIRPSHTKFVLLAIADNADHNGFAYPSVETLSNKCSQDRKTVIDSLNELESLGLLRDTGERKGATGQVKVYRIIGLPNSSKHYVYRLESEDGDFYIGVRSCFDSPSTDDYMGSGKWPRLMRKAGKKITKTILSEWQSREEAEAEETRIIRDSIEQSRCRNCSVPRLKQYRVANETVPCSHSNSTVDGTQNHKNHHEPSITIKADAEKKETSFTVEDLSIANIILADLRSINPGHKEPNLNRWANTIRLMRERDGRTLSEIIDLWQWANKNSFWCSNILSPDKLRAKWDQLTLQQKRGTQNAKPSKLQIAAAAIRDADERAGRRRQNTAFQDGLQEPGLLTIPYRSADGDSGND